jgi:hypothetical protein
MPPPYRDFAIWTLSDLAVRKTEDDGITFTGNHICAQHTLPTRTENESDEQFAARLRLFRSRLPRHSDSSERIALATRALMLAGEKAYIAADIIRVWLKELPAKKKLEFENAGIGYAFRPVVFPIGSTRRNRRTKARKSTLSPEESETETIRVQAAEFIRTHKNFDGLFQRKFDSYWAAHPDAEWYARAEAPTIASVADFEKLTGPFEWVMAMPVPAAAHFFHEQGKFEQALPYYEKSIWAARQAEMHEDFRAFLLNWFADEAERCQNHQPMGPSPDYRGPRVRTPDPPTNGSITFASEPAVQ